MIGKMGQTIAMWQYIVLLTALLILTIGSQPLNAGEKVAQLNNVRLHALEIAGVINMIEASPSGHFVYRKDLPDKCKTVEIEKGFVNLSTEGASFVAGIVQVEHIEVVPISINCENKKSLEFTRKLGVIEVR